MLLLIKDHYLNLLDMFVLKHLIQLGGVPCPEGGLGTPVDVSGNQLTTIT